MNDNELDNIAAVCLCIFSLTLFFGLIFMHVTAYAATAEELTDGKISAYDCAGGELDFDPESGALCVGPARFLFDEDALSEGERYVYDDGISTINCVEDFEYDMMPSGEGSIRFYVKGSDGSLSGVGSLFRVRFSEGIYESPDVDIEEEDGSIRLAVHPVAGCRVVTRITGQKNGYEEEIVSRTEFELKDEGRYKVRVYAEDGLGHRSYADIPEEFVIDRTPPVITVPDTIPAISKEKIEIPLAASDAVSGVQAVYVMCGDKTYSADSITISPPFRGRIECRAVDNKGNASEKICLGEDIIVDDDPPVISCEACSIDEKTLSLMTGATDPSSYVRLVEITSGDRTLYKGSGKKEKVSIDISGMSYGKKVFGIRAWDVAGNVASSSFSVEKADGRAPLISFSGAKDRGIYGKDVSLDISSPDDSDDECSVESVITSYSLKGEYQGESTSSEKKLLFTKSGIYIVTSSATDSAGNTGKKSLAFAIDRDAPLILGLAGLNGRTLKSFMMAKTDGIAYDDSMVDVKVLLNGMDYNGEKITKSGKYRLSVLAMDEYGNNSTDEAAFEIKRQDMVS
ncbi:MAG: hypothetical protein IJU43_10715 [Lachnospiraceae bacterium]|nr:hypothetical protein [Lachnospiraceae bacterium]